MLFKEASPQVTKFYNIFIGTMFVIISISFAMLSTMIPINSNLFTLTVIVSSVFLVGYILFILLLDINKKLDLISHKE
jgi:hypothetical protein